MGEYPGPLIKDPEEIKNLSEFALFYHINRFWYDYNWLMYRWYTGRSMALEPGFVEDVNEVIYAKYYCIEQTKKFGLNPRTFVEGRVYGLSEDFLKWYCFYKNFLKNTLTTEERTTLLHAWDTGDTIPEFLPSGDWQNYEVTPEEREDLQS
ncbi:MAG: hypothetical protein ACOX0X_01820 [Candidatus Dojkabacteria bacterium]